jgi:penicillin-binding protein 2
MEQKERSRKTLRAIISSIYKIDEKELPNLKKRIDIASVVALLLVACLVFRLWFLQIHKGGEYKKLSENNRIRVQSLAAPRGNIFDRTGRQIITNRPSFNILWTQEDAPNPEEVLKEVAKILKEDISTLLDRIRQAVDRPRFMPVRLAEDIDWNSLVQIENHRFELPGINVEALPTRDYLYADMASHLVGYLGEISSLELQQHQEEGYQPGDQIGKMGIEKLFEKDLRGEKGYRYLEVDVHGFEQKVLETQDSLAGSDIYLTIDIDLQRVAEKALEDKAGAVVAMDVNSGRILALASAPPLTLTNFIGGISQKDWDELINNPRSPLLNKTIQGQYPPGSTYKIVTAYAGLSEGVIDRDTVFYCNGTLKFGNRTYGCWKRAGHGPVNLQKALTESCDVYFYLVGQRLGVDRLASYARDFGLGEKTQIELEHEKSGLAPTSEWKLRRHQEPWQEGETLSVAIGQGFNLVTPLQACRMAVVAANGGTLYRPQYIEKIIGPDSTVIRSFSPIIEKQMKDKHNFFDLINKGLVGVVNSKHGTGSSAKLEGITVAGKTGTAQVVHLKNVPTDLEGEVPYKYRDHAWFVCYAPAEKPEIAIAVLLEHGGHGGSAAGPVAKSVLMRYFGIDQQSD